MRFPCLVLLVCTAALGQSAPRDASGLVSTSVLPARPKAAFQLDALSPNVCFGQKVSPIPAPDGACSRRFQIDPRSLGSLYSLPGVNSHTEMTAQLDLKMVIHPPQSAIGTLPPGKPVLPHIYPHLKMLFIHGQSAAKPTDE